LLFDEPTESENSNVKQNSDNDKYTTPPHQHKSRLAISAQKSASNYTDVASAKQKSYLEASGNARTSTSKSITNLACFTKGNNSKKRFAEYDDSKSLAKKKSKCKVSRTVPDGQRTKNSGRPTLSGIGAKNQSYPHANDEITPNSKSGADALLGLTGKFLNK
jgi:hypothetical protein